MPQKKTGRPSSYSEAQLRAAIDAAIAETGEAKVSCVVAKLSELFNVPHTINIKSLDEAIVAVLQKRERLADEARIEALPDHVHQAAEQHAADCRRQFLSTAGRTLARQREAEASRRQEWELELDRTKELLRTRDRMLADAAAREAELTGTISAREEAIAALNTRVAELESALERSTTLEAVLRAFRDANRADASADSGGR